MKTVSSLLPLAPQAYGLGTGIALNADLGGEVRGWGSIRADGIWLYQFDVGKVIYRELTASGRTPSWIEIYNKKARRLSATAPLHHFGGYEMFTWAQWLAQARVVLEPLRPSLDRDVLEIGVGAGAFVAAIKEQHPETQVAWPSSRKLGRVFATSLLMLQLSWS